SEHLIELEYDFIHFDSLDERGIDTAILYRKGEIELMVSESMRLVYRNPENYDDTDISRVILYAKFKLGIHEIHSFVVHLPSRRDLDVNRPFRNEILTEIRNKLDQILLENPQAQIVVMGDFNGNPNDEDARIILKTTDVLNFTSNEMYNPMMLMFPQ